MLAIVISQQLNGLWSPQEERIVSLKHPFYREMQVGMRVRIAQSIEVT